MSLGNFQPPNSCLPPSIANSKLKPFVFRYRFPRAWQQFLSVDNGNPFLAVLLLPAMKTGEPLVLSAPVSPKLLDAIEEIQARDHTLSKVAIEVPVRERGLSPSRRTLHRGLFFSLGVDSFYSLFKNMQRHPADDETITQLIEAWS